MDPKALMRPVHGYSLEDFRAHWSAVRDCILIETLDDSGRPQGEAIVHVEQLYQADEDGAFGLVSYIACSDEYYQYWTKNDMSQNTYHHFCRASSVRSCGSKVGKQGIVHVMKWTAVTKSECEKILREWAYSPTLLNKSIRPVPAGVKALEAEATTTRKAAPPLPPPSLASEGAGEPEDRPRSHRHRKRKGEPEEDEESEHADRDRGRRRRRMAKPVTPPREAPPPRPKNMTKDKGQTALDKMLDEDALDLDSEQLQNQAELKLATLRESLNKKKAATSSREPGAILAGRAAAVAETEVKKKKKPDKAITLLKALTGKKVKDEADYDEDGNDDHSSDEETDSDGDDTKLLGDGRGSSSAAGKQRKLRQLSERRPGRLLSTGYKKMHDQVGTHYGGLSDHKNVLQPVALRYLLSFALPQMQGGISHDRYRELRSIATSLDLLVEGRTGMAGDLLMQRFKSILMSLRDGSDAAARWIELLPFDEVATMSSEQEEYMARGMALHHAKSAKMLQQVAQG